MEPAMIALRRPGHAPTMQAILAGSGEELALNIRLLSDDAAQRDSVVAANWHLALIALLGAGPHFKTTHHALSALFNLASHIASVRLQLVYAGVAAPTVALLRTTEGTASVYTSHIISFALDLFYVIAC